MWYMLAEIPDASRISSVNNFRSLQSLIGSKEIDLFKDGVLCPLEVYTGEQTCFQQANGMNDENFKKRCQYCIVSLKREKKLKEKLKISEDFIRKMNHNLEVDAVKITELIRNRATKLHQTRQENIMLNKINNQHSSKLIDCEKKIHDLNVLVAQLRIENSSLKEILPKSYKDGVLKKSVDHSGNHSNATKPVHLEGNIEQKVDTSVNSAMQKLFSGNVKIPENNYSLLPYLCTSTPKKYLLSSQSEDVSGGLEEQELTDQCNRSCLTKDPTSYGHVVKSCDESSDVICDESCYIMELVKRAAEVREQLTRVNDLVKNFTSTQHIV